MSCSPSSNSTMSMAELYPLGLTSPNQSTYPLDPTSPLHPTLQDLRQNYIHCISPSPNQSLYPLDPTSPLHQAIHDIWHDYIHWLSSSPNQSPQPIPLDPTSPNQSPQPIPLDPTSPNQSPQPIPLDPTSPNQSPQPIPLDPTSPNQSPQPIPLDLSCPPAIYQQPHHSLKQKCSICSLSICYLNIKTKCNHQFHGSCLIKWFRESALTCPECGATFRWQDALDIASMMHYHEVHNHVMFLESIIPGEMYQGDGTLVLEKEMGCRCVFCREHISDLFELFIASGNCRHFFHNECANVYFLDSDENEEELEGTIFSSSVKQRMIENMLVETNYCPDCIQPLNINNRKRLEAIAKIDECRNYS